VEDADAQWIQIVAGHKFATKVGAKSKCARIMRNALDLEFQIAGHGRGIIGRPEKKNLLVIVLDARKKANVKVEKPATILNASMNAAQRNQTVGEKILVRNLATAEFVSTAVDL